jgi:hypothetical protein
VIDFNRNKQDRIIYLGISMLVILMVVLCYKRQTLNYGVETDFLGGFVPEAIRFLNGNPLKLTYHPPFYSIILSLIYFIFKNWKLSGWILSLISSCIVMIMSYHFIKLIFGKKEAVGAILAFIFSWGFISYSIQASSDMFFFAVYYCCMFAIAMAEKKQKKYFWIIGGIFAGLVFLTRSNGIPIMFVLLFAVVSKCKNISKKKIFVFMVSGAMFPIIFWTLYAKISNSPVYVQSNYGNLALSYFSKGGDRISGDATVEASKEFSNIWQVLTKDPKHILYRYVKDLLNDSKSLFTDGTVIAYPFILFALPGLILLFLNNFDKFKLILLVNLLAMILFVNLHAWMSRLYLFMIPILGAGIITLIGNMNLKFNLKPNTKSLFIIVPILILIFLTNIKIHYREFVKSEAIDSLAASKVLINRKNIKKTLIISRKPHLSFYTGFKGHGFPDVKTFEELKVAIKNMIFPYNTNTAAYLFYGFSERFLRPQFSMLENSDFYSPWLKKVDSGNEKGGWVLYKILSNNL